MAAFVSALIWSFVFLPKSLFDSRGVDKRIRRVVRFVGAAILTAFLIFLVLGIEPRNYLVNAVLVTQRLLRNQLVQLLMALIFAPIPLLLILGFIHRRLPPRTIFWRNLPSIPRSIVRLVWGLRYVAVLLLVPMLAAIVTAPGILTQVTAAIFPNDPFTLEANFVLRAEDILPSFFATATVALLLYHAPERKGGYRPLWLLRVLLGISCVIAYFSLANSPTFSHEMIVLPAVIAAVLLIPVQRELC